jgi:hypothetical protein
VDPTGLTPGLFATGIMRAEIFFVENAPKIEQVTRNVLTAIASGIVMNEAVKNSGEITVPVPAIAGENGVPKASESSHLIDERGQKHILEGNGVDSGGHRAGTGTPGKSEFPKEWSDQKILETISDVATDPASSREAGKWGTTISTGVRDGIEIKTFDNGSRINSGFPSNTPRNPQ